MQANSVQTISSTASALYEYEFALPSGAQNLLLIYAPLNIASPNGSIAESSFSLARNGVDIFTSSNNFLNVNGGNLSPGDYVLTIEAEASVGNAVPEFVGGQTDFVLIFSPVAVPEPGSSTLLAIAMTAFSLRRRRRS